MARLTPYLTVHDGAAALDFYAAAFGAREQGERYVEDDGRIGHATCAVGDDVFYLSDEFTDYGAYAPATLGHSTTAIVLVVDDVDTVYAAAIAAGGTADRPPSVTVLGTAMVLVLGACSGDSGGSAATTAWESYEDLNAFLRETAQAVGVEHPSQDTTRPEVRTCQRPQRAGSGYQIPLAKVEGPAAEGGSDILTAVAQHWTEAGYEVTQTAGVVRAEDQTDGSLRALYVPGGNLTLTGSTPCMAKAGTAPQ